MKIFLFIFLLLNSYFGLSQKLILRDFDFSNGKTTLFICHDSSFSDVAYCSCKYITNKYNLDSLKMNWQGEITDTLLECGYNYFLYVIDVDSIISSIKVNTECGQAVTRGYIVNFKGNLLENLYPDKVAHKEIFYFPSLEAACHKYELIKANKDCFVTNSNADFFKMLTLCS